MLLAIDTATEWAGVALYDTSGLLAEANWNTGRNHSAQVVPLAHHLLGNLGASVGDLTGIGVSLGPGSWSGLRVGLSIAKGIALAAQLPVLGVSSLDTLAYPHQRTGRSVVAAIRLGRDRYAVAEYRLRRSWTRIGVERNETRDQLIAGIPELALVCGDIDVRLAAAINAARGTGVVVPMPSISARRAGYLAEIAWGRLQAGEKDDVVALEPTYLGAAVKDKT